MGHTIFLQKILFLVAIIYLNCFSQNSEMKPGFNFKIENIIRRGEQKDFDWDTPSKLSISKEGNLFILDTKNNRILVYDENMKMIKQIGGEGDKNGFFRSPLDLKIGRDGFLYVLDFDNARIQIFNAAGEFIRVVKVPRYTFTFTIDEEGNMYINSPDELGSIAKLDRNGNRLKTFGTLVEKDRQKYTMNWAYLEYDYSSKKIIASYQYFPIIQIYKVDGTLLTEFEMDSKNVQGLKSAEMPSWVGDNLAAKIFSIGLTVRNGFGYVILSHSLQTQYPVLYVFDLDGKKINEVPIQEKENQPIAFLTSICATGGKYYLTTDDGKIYIFN
jgi:hypothetical protein